MNRRNSTSLTVLSLLGSVLVFAGWVVAIIPAIQHLRSVVLVTTLAVIGLAIFLIPAGLDIFSGSQSADKGGVSAEIVALAPAILLFLIAVFVVPTSPGSKAAAIGVEALGMVLYGRAWFLAHGHNSADHAGSIGRGRGAAAG